MNKLLKSLFIVAASFAIIACNKETPVQVVDNGNALVELTIIANNPEALPATRTEMRGTTPYWSVGDSIGVSNGTNTNYKFTTDITSSATTASFKGTTSVNETLYAYYPYQKNGVSTKNGTTGALFDLPSEQAPTVSSFDGAADVMVAKSFTVPEETTTVEGLQFARLGAIVKVVLKDNESIMNNQHPSSVSMEAESALAGRFVIDMKNQCLSSIYYGASNIVTAKYDSDTKYKIDNTNGTYFVVYPQTLDSGSSLTITAVTEDYSISKTITLNQDIVLLPGKVNTLNISLSADNITSNASATPYALYSGDLTEGDYVIVNSGLAMKASVASDRFEYTNVTVTDDKILNPSPEIIWHIASSEDYWTIYNASTNKFAASTGAKNKAQLLADGTDDMSLWTVSGASSYDFINKKNTANKVNAYLRYNSGYGFACYSESTGSSLSLYKISDGKTDAGISYSSSSVSLTYGETFTQPTLSNPHNLVVSYVSSDTDVATVTTDGDITIIGVGTSSITCSWEEQKIGDITYRAGSATCAITVNKIAVSISFDNPTTTVAVSSTIKNAATVTPSNLTLNYSSSNTNVATVSSDGTVTGVSNGNVTITASYVGDATHEAASAYYNITVGSANDGSQDHPFTVSEVRAYMDASESNRGPVYISGIVSSIYAAYDAAHGTGIFYISDDGEATSDQFEAYSVKFLGNNAWVNGNSQIAVGDEVVVYGAVLQIYNETTYETKSNSGSYLYLLNGSTTETVPTITKTDISGVSADGVTGATTSITLTNADGWSASVSGDGTVVTSAAISNNTISYNVAANTGDARTGVITVTLNKSGRTPFVAEIYVSQDANANVNESTIEFTYSSNGGLSTTAGEQTGTIGDISLYLENGALNSNYQDIRIYKSKKMTVSTSKGSITKIVITSKSTDASANGPGKFGNGAPTGFEVSSDNTTGTWTGSSTSVDFTATDAQVRMISIAVTYKLNP